MCNLAMKKIALLLLFILYEWVPNEASRASYLAPTVAECLTAAHSRLMKGIFSIASLAMGLVSIA